MGLYLDYVSETLYFEATNLANQLALKVSQHYGKKLEEVKCFDIQNYVEEVEDVEFLTVKFGKHLSKMMLGATSKVNGEIIISINDDLMLERKNFTAMHEIIHYYRDIPDADNGHTFSDMIQEDGYFPEDMAKEYRANTGAAVLMANDEALLYALNKFATFEQVADYFFMSKSALQNRIRDYLVYVENCTPQYAFSLINNYRYGDGKKMHALFDK